MKIIRFSCNGLFLSEKLDELLKVEGVFCKRQILRLPLNLMPLL